MSGDGRITAVGGPSPFTLHVYEVSLGPVGGELTPTPFLNPLMAVAVIVAASIIVLGYRFGRR